jgi:hypothetical protein
VVIEKTALLTDSVSQLSKQATLDIVPSFNFEILKDKIHAVKV